MNIKARYTEASQNIQRAVQSVMAAFFANAPARPQRKSTAAR